LKNYYLKGGVAMELRFAEGARATKDVDIGLAGERAERLQNFRNALALGFDEFSFQLKGKPLTMDNADAVRLELGVLYRTRAWQTIDVDLGPAGSDAVDFVEPTIPGLSAMGLRIPSPVRCLNLSEQVAQKLHACTGPYSKGRARDVLDILLIDLLGKMNAKTVRVAAEHVFNQRATHKFPPEIKLPAEWKPELEALAKELGYPATTAAEIEVLLRICVGKIATAN
jgi:hypothetical protein